MIIRLLTLAVDDLEAGRRFYERQQAGLGDYFVDVVPMYNAVKILDFSLMTKLNFTVDDHVVPQLLTSALEAFEIAHPNGKKREDKLETFGLLWGYVIPEREDRDPRIVASIATVETSALRKNGSVTPDLQSLKMKMEFVGRYWPHLEVVGTFHSHPYNSLDEVRDCKGWRASTVKGDTEFWPYIHKELFPTTPYLGHLIVTVTGLSKMGWALPKDIEGNSGFELSMGYRKLWITSYGTELNYLESDNDDEDECEVEYTMMESLPSLDLPSLKRRVLGN